MTQQLDKGQRGLQSTSQHDYILLDGSGSMLGSKWWPSLSSIDAFVATMKTQNVNTQLILATFDGTDPHMEQRNQPIAEWQNLCDSSIGSYGGYTPLYDAINFCVRRLREIDPPRAHILIVTDGDENASKFTSLEQAKKLLDWCRAKGWQVTFIGCNFDNKAQAKLLGSDAGSAIGVAQERLSDATRELAKKRAAYGLYGTPMHFTEGEREQFGGYLAAPATEGGSASD